MAELLEFSALHYNQEKVHQIREVLCKPTSNLSPVEVEDLKKKNPYQYTQLLFPEENGEEVSRSRTKVLYGWLLRDVVLVDNDSGFYIDEQEFELAGQSLVRRTLITLVKLDDQICPVYKSSPQEIETVFQSLKDSESLFENSLLLYKDAEKSMDAVFESFVVKENLVIEGADENRKFHRLYRIASEEKIAEIKQYFLDKKFILAQGTANFEAALRYQEEKKQELGEAYTGKESFNYLMGMLVNTQDPTFKMVPTHRLIRKEGFDPVNFLKQIQKDYKLAAIELTDDGRLIKAARIKLKKTLYQYQQKGIPAFGVYFRRIPKKYFVLVLKNETRSGFEASDLPEETKLLPPLVFNQTVLKPILKIDEEVISGELFYCQGENWALDAVKRGSFDLAFLLSGVDPALIEKSADKDLILPANLMEIYPEMINGMTLYSGKYSLRKRV